VAAKTKTPDLSGWWVLGAALEREVRQRGKKCGRGILQYRVKTGQLLVVKAACGAQLVRIEDALQSCDDQR
jgi:hypothetical protein